MISQESFIKASMGKKEKSQRRFSKLLRICNRLLPVKVKIDKSRISEYLFLTICRASDFDMVLASIDTLTRNSTLLPNRFVVVSDGSWPLLVGEKYFKRHGINVKCVDWSECADFYKNLCPSLTKWAQGHIWGKKMAAILFFSENHKVLFSDPDILWYNTPLTEEELLNCKLKLSIDNSHNYDDEFIKACGFEKLYDTIEPINCGAVYIHGGLSLLGKDALQCIEYEANHYGKFAEQTVFAIMDLSYSKRWTMNEITSEIHDLLNNFSSKTIHYDNMIARHYLWRLKWIYWKDYLLDRFL